MRCNLVRFATAYVLPDRGVMRVVIEDAQEAAILAARFRAMAYALGPTVELSAVLPDGRVLRSFRGGRSAAAQCASLNERMEDYLSRVDQLRGNR